MFSSGCAIKAWPFFLGGCVCFLPLGDGGGSLSARRQKHKIIGAHSCLSRKQIMVVKVAASYSVKLFSAV